MIEDASFLFGEKRYQKKMNLCRQMEQTIESELTFQEVLASCNLTGKEKLEKLWIDEQLQKEFLIAVNQKNEQLGDLFYLPLICLYIEPQTKQQICNQDLEVLLNNFGQVLKIVNKEFKSYVLMSTIVESWLAAKLLNNTMFEKDNVQYRLHVQLCFEDASLHHIFQFNHQEQTENDFIIDITNNPTWMENIGKEFRYLSIFEIDMEGYQQEFRIKERIMGIKGCNIVRIYYLVEKGLAFLNKQIQEEGKKELEIKILVNNDRGYANQLVIMSNIWNKFTLAQRYANELFAQIKEEFKFYQDHQLQSLQESRVKRMDKFFLPLDIQYQYDSDN